MVRDRTVLGAARAYASRRQQLAAVYVEIIRNTPILVQIFMLYFALPQAGIRLNAFTAAWLAVMLWGGAFNTENFRAGFEAVPTRYREAAQALDLRLARHLPQRDAPDRRPHLAAVVDQHLHLGREEHLADVRDRLPRATTAINIANLTLETLEALTVLAVGYLALVWSLSAAIRLLESRLALPETR